MLGLFVQKHAVAVQAFHNVSVIYVTADYRLRFGQTEMTRNNFNGIDEIRFYFGKSGNTFIDGWNYLKLYMRALSMLAKPDLIHVHVLTRAAVPAFLMKVTKGIPYIITEHWSRYLPANVASGAFNGILRRMITKLVVMHAEAVTTVTNNLATAMKALGLKNRYYITPNVVDTTHFYPLKKFPVRDKKIFLHVSCFDEPAKNIKGIIDATVSLAGTRTDFNLVITGDGTDYREVFEYAQRTGLEGNRITFTGLLEGEQLTRIMREANAFVMFSNYENLPCTIIESMASGVPVISTDVGGIKEHLHSRFGILIKAGDKEAMINSMIAVLDNPSGFDIKGMREYAINHFSNESVGKMFSEIYFQSGLTVN